MLILQQPHQTELSTSALCISSQKGNLTGKKDFNFAITTPMVTRTPRAILLTTWKHNENFPVLFWNLIWNFPCQESPPKFFENIALE